MYLMFQENNLDIQATFIVLTFFFFKENLLIKIVKVKSHGLQHKNRDH